MIRFFNVFRLKVEEKLKKNKMEDIGIEEFFVYLFGSLIIEKDISFIENIRNETNRLSI